MRSWFATAWCCWDGGWGRTTPGNDRSPAARTTPGSGESPESAAARELAEETGLVANAGTPIGWTSDVFAAEGLHFVPLHHLVDPTGEPSVLEPGKVAGRSANPNIVHLGL
ncbi:NUDIX domain-containing protein [Saccharopolyspora spinosa]|uniref:NUDIX domain-containing protein n=1 Tax=Saccharopolyspora spinosa TaxID=60894 RepID=UPI002351EA3E|nr:NUDIX domain-containing protein [Saccharopolyspora spinosa]